MYSRFVFVCNNSWESLILAHPSKNLDFISTNRFGKSSIPRITNELNWRTYKVPLCDQQHCKTTFLVGAYTANCGYVDMAPCGLCCIQALEGTDLSTWLWNHCNSYFPSNALLVPNCVVKCALNATFPHLHSGGPTGLFNWENLPWVRGWQSGLTDKVISLGLRLFIILRVALVGVGL